MYAFNFDQESRFREFHFLLGNSAHIVIGKAEMSDGSGFKKEMASSWKESTVYLLVP